MKALFLTLFFVTSAFAQTPIGVYQLDTVHSQIETFEKTSKVNGCIEVSEDFSQSKLTIEADDLSFESIEFLGPIENFEVRGTLTYKGVSSIENLKGRYFGMTENVFGNKTLFSFSGKDFSVKIFATKPSGSATAIYKVVEDIVK